MSDASKPSVCVGCIYAKWDRYPSGRLDRRKSGRCTWTLDDALPKAFVWISPPKPIGGWINREHPAALKTESHCDFKKEAKP
jgi:hypothetical protein